MLLRDSNSVKLKRGKDCVSILLLFNYAGQPYKARLNQVRIQ